MLYAIYFTLQNNRPICLENLFDLVTPVEILTYEVVLVAEIYCAIIFSMVLYREVLVTFDHNQFSNTLYVSLDELIMNSF